MGEANPSDGTTTRRDNITKTKLAEVLGMSQPNVSKALNPKEKKCFTLEQVIKIADYFNVTIDSLVGSSRTDTIVSANNSRDIAAFLAQCIDNEKAKISYIDVEQTVYLEDYDPSEPYCPYRKTTKKVNYPVLYFSDYWQIQDYAESDDDYSELSQEAFQCGNETLNVHINKFLQHFIQIHGLYKKGELSEEIYRTVVQDLLNHVPEK
jgi:plasmid maintenance system antidote protein VapI